MASVTISKRLKVKCPNITLGVIEFNTIVTLKEESFWTKVTDYCNNLFPSIKDINLKSIYEIKISRDSYVKLGRDPDRYNLSAEALLKRIKSGKEIYQINNLVDIINYLSIKYFYPIGVYDIDKISGEVIFDIGDQGEEFESLAKGNFSIHHLPVFRDSVSCFGSPTSDSKRTSITLSTKNALIIIISFSGKPEMLNAVNKCIELIDEYAEAKNIVVNIIE